MPCNSPALCKGDGAERFVAVNVDLVDGEKRADAKVRLRRAGNQNKREYCTDQKMDRPRHGWVWWSGLGLGDRSKIALRGCGSAPSLLFLISITARPFLISVAFQLRNDWQL